MTHITTHAYTLHDASNLHHNTGGFFPLYIVSHLSLVARSIAEDEHIVNSVVIKSL
jgi:hypothetical protein